VEQLPEQSAQKSDALANRGISINISSSQISGGLALVQGENNYVAMETCLGASSTEKHLTQEQVVQMIATIEQLVETTEELPETIKKKSLRHLGRAKEELELPEPDKQFAACDLKQMAQTLLTSNSTVPATKLLWQNIEPILMELPAWLDVPRNFFK
jgi:hypothetical protein